MLENLKKQKMNKDQTKQKTQEWLKAYLTS